VIIELAEEEVMLPAPPPVAPAAPALKVVDVKPQEDMTSSMSMNPHFVRKPNHRAQ
jgi:hypothetical protein